MAPNPAPGLLSDGEWRRIEARSGTHAWGLARRAVADLIPPDYDTVDDPDEWVVEHTNGGPS